MTQKMGDAGGGAQFDWSNPWNEKPKPSDNVHTRKQWLDELAQSHMEDHHQPAGAYRVYAQLGYKMSEIPAYKRDMANSGPHTGQTTDNGGGAGRHNPGEGNPTTSSANLGGAGTVGEIISFFRSKGVPDVGIAAILGNWRVESDFNPNAFNSKEGAIGFGQWEGGRRTNLQAFAAARGTTETDPMTQLEFAWHEMQADGIASQLKTATNVWDAANLVNRHYEVSGDYTTDREQYANAYLSNGFKGVSTVRVPAGTSVSDYGNGQGVKLGATDYKAALGSLEGLVQGVPELRGILNQAVSGGWSTDKFMQAIQGTNWWKTHDSAARSLIAQSFADPAEYKNQVGGASRTIRETASQMGVTLDGQQIHTLAMRSLIEGWDSQALQDAVGGAWNAKDGLMGNAAQTAQQLQQIYGDYGLPISDSALNHRVEQILSGRQTIDTYTQAAIDAAKSMYPALSHQLTQGMTVKDIADPYIQSEANILELDPHTVNIQSPMIKKALQGTIVQQGDKAQATSTPLWQFEQRLRADPRWQYTQNAHNDVSGVLNYLGQSWGFEA